ncbi:MAG: hypothetical protein SPD11_10850 [Sphaerochaetaceae bacterium]|nr:hypothetical protein [Sphaerochaetaceae bacterium]
MHKKEKRERVPLKQLIKERKPIFFMYVFLRILVVAVMVAQIFNGNFENVFLCVLTLILFMIPSFIESNYGIDIPDVLEVIILLFIFAAEILGEIRAYYIAYPFWDTMLHTINGFLAAAIGFSLVDIFNRNEKFTFSLSPLFLAIVAFCFSMTIGVLWEFFEFSMDWFFRMDMQKDTVVHAINTVMLDPTSSNKVVHINGITSVIVNGQDLGLGGYLDIGLIDTMKDLFVNFIGAVVFSAIGYVYVKKRGQGRFAKQFIPQVMEVPQKPIQNTKKNRKKQAGTGTAQTVPQGKDTPQGKDIPPTPQGN